MNALWLVMKKKYIFSQRNKSEYECCTLVMEITVEDERDRELCFVDSHATKTAISLKSNKLMEYRILFSIKFILFIYQS